MRFSDKQHRPRRWAAILLGLLILLLPSVCSAEAASSAAASPAAVSTPDASEPADDTGSEIDQDVTRSVAASLAAGLLHSALINYDGLLYLWGDNTYGQLGLEGQDYCDSPQWLELADAAVSVSLGAYHSMVLLADGTVWTFGRNAYGQLGDGTTNNANEPMMVDGLPTIVAISAGSWHSLALGKDGSVWAWGNNTNSQIGDVDSEPISGTGGQILGSRVLRPVCVVKSGAAAIAAGGLHSLYLDENGQVYAWGDNSKGQLGDGTTQPHAVPAIVPGLNKITAIAAGYQHSLALSRSDSAGRLFAWGDDSLGQLGIGAGLTAESFRNVPVRVDLTGDTNPDNDQAIRVMAAYAQSAVTVPARKADGKAIAGRQQLLVWGSNANGQLALGAISSQNRPQAVNGTFSGWTGSDFLPFDAVALGGSHMLVLSSKGLLAAAGRGDRGQLGNLSVLDRDRLVPVDFPDVIRPVWADGSALSAVRTPEGGLLVRWPAAQDNRVVVNYRLELSDPQGGTLTVDAGQKLAWTLSAADPETAYQVTVMACDTGSLEASRITLSRLVGYVLPASASESSVEDYFSQVKQSVPQVSFIVSNWQPDARNLVRPLEVPWNTETIYGSSSIAPPADWRGFCWLAAAGAFLALLALAHHLVKRGFKQSHPAARLLQAFLAAFR